jgi:hypothetical protein
MKKETKTTREILIDAIIDLAGDEYQTSNDFIKLAKSPEQQLVEELINIAEYFRDRDND